MKRVYIIVWAFRVKPDRVSEFERVYGQNGDWVNLFSTSADYRGSTLLRSATSERSYLTIDRWVSKESYGSFHSARAEEYAKLDQACAELTESEEKIGEFVES